MSKKFENQTFEDQIIQLDGNEYSNCTFKRCRLQYGGLAGVSLRDNNFNECRWSFTDAAARTLNFLTAIYRGAGKGGKELVEETFKNIIEGIYLSSIN